MENRIEHFNKACLNTAFLSLNEDIKDFLKNESLKNYFSFSQVQNIINFAIDLQMWDEDIRNIWDNTKTRKELFAKIRENYETLRNKPKLYSPCSGKTQKKTLDISVIKKETLGFGSCPVASSKTRCCNLLTLDAIEGCGFDCSYCSIQTFYGNKIIKNENFAKKLQNIKLDKNQIYHIGTGQASDSLMFGNSVNILDALIEFAKVNPNVILEFKTKSSNISYLLQNIIPKNIICTFSLNPQIIIDNEEKLTASLEQRLTSAKTLSKKGILVGFHFHPMIYFKGWEDEYKKLAQLLMQNFDPQNVVMVSMGTLTFIKPVIKNIREKGNKNKILQMPLCDASGKYSYPLNIKEMMFSTLYNELAPWHKKVFFYLCMEDASLWKNVFKYEYKNNIEFESSMLNSYMNKINKKKQK